SRPARSTRGPGAPGPLLSARFGLLSRGGCTGPREEGEGTDRSDRELDERRGDEVSSPRDQLSSTTWVLMPPKPKAFTPARRVALFPPHGSASVSRRNRVLARCGWGCETWRVGGSTPWWTASAALMRPAAPAAGM